MTALRELIKISRHLPLEVREDVNQRVFDWLVSDGDEDDPYVHQQLEFANRFVPKETAE